VNFHYDDIVHTLQNTIDSCINSAIDRRGYVLLHRFTKCSEITQCNGHYAVQGHSRSPILVPIESSYTTLPSKGFPWNDLRKILPGCQQMANVPNGIETYPYVPYPTRLEDFCPRLHYGGHISHRPASKSTSSSAIAERSSCRVG